MELCPAPQGCMCALAPGAVIAPCSMGSSSREPKGEMPLNKPDPVGGRGWDRGWWAKEGCLIAVCTRDVQTVISKEERVGEGKR